jgi:hypothetical protein
MSIRILMVVLAASLALGGSILPGSAEPQMAAAAAQRNNDAHAPAAYRLVTRPAADYRMLTARVIGSAAGGAYRLTPAEYLPETVSTNAVDGYPAGCCCLFLPCVNR